MHPDLASDLKSLEGRGLIKLDIPYTILERVGKTGFVISIKES